MPDKKTKAVKSRFDQLNSAFQRLDLFGSDVSLRENGQEQFTTCFGALISLLILIVVFNYAVKKYTTLVEYGDTVYQSIDVNENDQVVPFSEHQFTYGAFYFKYSAFEDPFDGVKYNWRRDSDKLLVFSLRGPSIDPLTGENTWIELDVHKCTEGDLVYE